MGPDAEDKGHELYEYLFLPASACESMSPIKKNSLGLSICQNSIYSKGRNVFMTQTALV